jgi:hypothetical protein
MGTAAVTKRDLSWSREGALETVSAMRSSDDGAKVDFDLAEECIRLEALLLVSWFPFFEQCWSRRWYWHVAVGDPRLVSANERFIKGVEQEIRDNIALIPMLILYSACLVEVYSTMMEAARMGELVTSEFATEGATTQLRSKRMFHTIVVMRDSNTRSKLGKFVTNGGISPE